MLLWDEYKLKTGQLKTKSGRWVGYGGLDGASSRLEKYVIDVAPTVGMACGHF